MLEGSDFGQRCFVFEYFTEPGFYTPVLYMKYCCMNTFVIRVYGANQYERGENIPPLMLTYYYSWIPAGTREKAGASVYLESR